MQIANNPVQYNYSGKQYNLPTYKGINLHILDGSGHGDNMKHFAQAIMKGTNQDVDIILHQVETNSVDKNLKQMGSLLNVLKSLADKFKPGDFVALPGIAPVPVLNLTDRIRDIFGKHNYLNPQNIHYYKNLLLALLNKFYYDKSSHVKEQLFHLDKNQQDLGQTYGVINEINKLVKKGVHVYIPAGHGYDSGIKWMSEQKNLKNELYHYISKGVDKDGSISDLFDEARSRNFYDFNLLALSDAHIVNVNGVKDQKYVFSSEDLLTNDAARGVYNFTPIRDWNGNVIGYSYHDGKNVEYPYEEFTANDEIANLCKYVGRDYRDFRSSIQENDKFVKTLKAGKDTSDIPDRLYPISDVYEQREIEGRGLHLLGNLTDKDRKLVFDINSSGEILFQKTNCEGSERPSVLQMWGSCFATLNAIKRDIVRGSVDKSKLEYFINMGDNDCDRGMYESAEHYYNNALDILHPNRMSLNMSKEAYKMYKKLYSVLIKNNKTEPAKNIANTIIDLKAKRIIDLLSFSPVYIRERYKIAKYYADIKEFCLRSGDYDSAEKCEWAVRELEKGSIFAKKIIKRRAERNSYIGDIYNECH